MFSEEAPGFLGANWPIGVPGPGPSGPGPQILKIAASSTAQSTALNCSFSMAKRMFFRGGPWVPRGQLGPLPWALGPWAQHAKDSSVINCTVDCFELAAFSIGIICFLDGAPGSVGEET